MITRRRFWFINLFGLVSLLLVCMITMLGTACMPSKITSESSSGSTAITSVVTPPVSNPSSPVVTTGSVGPGTYYVAKNGSDNNPGTQAQPWLTIQKAAGTLVAGDTVYVESGTYNEQVVPANSGTAGAWITYKAYPGETVIIDGTGLDIQITGIFNIIGESYINVEGFQITNSSYAGVALYGEDHYINLVNLKINHTQWSGIAALYNRLLPTPQGHISNIVVDGCDISNTNQNALDEAISFRAVSNFEIKNSIIHDVQANKEGIDIKEGCSNGAIHHCEVYNAEQGIYIDSGVAETNISIYNNRLYNNRLSGVMIGSEGGGSVTLVNIYNNLIYNNYRGFLVSPDSFHKNFNFINNTLYNNYESEISIFDGAIYQQESVIRNNILYSNRPDANLIQYNASSSKITIDNNLFYALSYSSSNFYGTNYILGKDPLLVNPAEANFNLQSSSPAIDAGSPISAPAKDFIDTPRPQGNGYDIGAYEYLPPVASPSASSTN